MLITKTETGFTPDHGVWSLGLAVSEDTSDVGWECATTEPFTSTSSGPRVQNLCFCISNTEVNEHVFCSTAVKFTSKPVVEQCFFNTEVFDKQSNSRGVDVVLLCRLF